MAARDFGISDSRSGFTSRQRQSFSLDRARFCRHGFFSADYVRGSVVVVMPPTAGHTAS